MPSPRRYGRVEAKGLGRRKGEKTRLSIMCVLCVSTGKRGRGERLGFTKEGDEGDVLYWMLINDTGYHSLPSLHHLFNSCSEHQQKVIRTWWSRDNKVRPYPYPSLFDHTQKTYPFPVLATLLVLLTYRNQQRGARADPAVVVTFIPYEYQSSRPTKPTPTHIIPLIIRIIYNSFNGS